MIRSPKSIIAELEKLISSEKIDVKNFDEVGKDYKYEPIQQYLKSLQIQVKPESASHELFNTIIKDVLKYDTFHEVNIGTGFVDFAIRESGGNPILIELKPLFKLIKSKEILKPDKLEFSEHKEQILKYLKNNEYVILTNLREAFLFSRNAIIDFEPFKELLFTELLSTFLEYQGNLWDTIRRIEDQHIKIDLDKSFFADLKTWYNEFRKIEILPNGKFSKEELIVLLLNKIIFIRTLDDLGLIQFNHLVDEYKNKKDKWEAKGSERILTTFFNELEEYFDYFYDTELFKEKFWDYVVKEKSNTDKFLLIFETTLGLDAWNRTHGRGMLHYNYRWIDEDVFGKAYETFIAENRKDSGIFYTPREITEYMSKGLVQYLFEPLVEEIEKLVDKDVVEYDKADELLAKLYEIKIIDTASGSGSFLIKVLREIYQFYLRIDDKIKWVVSISGETLFDLPASFAATKEFRAKHNFDNHIKLISKIILRHIYAADIDERALETAKTNIWKEAIKLNPRIYNYKKLNGESSHILPNLELNFVRGDSLADLTAEKEIEILSTEFKDELKQLHKIRNNYIYNPFKPDEISDALKIKQNIFEKLKQELLEIEKPVFICLEFFSAYFDNEGNPFTEEERGFHGVIGNPPWEAVKPFEKEFAKKAKYSLDILDFKDWFANELETNPEFASDWNVYKGFYKNYNQYLKHRLKYQGIGDPNYYKLFFEKDLELLRKQGRMSLLVPSGIQTDKGCTELRKLITDSFSLHEIDSFENKGYVVEQNGDTYRTKLFVDVHPQFKFSIMSVNNVKAHPFTSFNARFYMTDPSELESKEVITYNLEMIKKFSPSNISFMEFRDKRDYELGLKIRSDYKLFLDLDYKLSTEFHMTNDSSYFYKEDVIEKYKDSSQFVPLYEGKMIHQYNSYYDKPRYYIDKQQIETVLYDKEIKKINRIYQSEDTQINTDEISLDFKNYRLAYRDVASSTNERTLIASIIHPNAFLGNTLNYIKRFDYELKEDQLNQNSLENFNLIIIMGLFNSFVLNYYLRSKITSHASFYFIYELPIPEITETHRQVLVEKGAQLLYHINDKRKYKPLMKELGVEPEKKIDPIKLRGDIEIFIAKELYGLSKEDWEYITSTFVYGGESETKKELEQIIQYTLSNY